MVEIYKFSQTITSFLFVGMRLLNKVGRNSFSKFSLKSVEYKNGDNQRFDRFSISEVIETSQFFSTFPDLMEMGKLVKLTKCCN
jgi:hypothetical protein